MLGKLTNPIWQNVVKMKYITLIPINKIYALTSLLSVVRITLQQIQHKGQFITGITAHFFLMRNSNLLHTLKSLILKH